MSAFNSSTDVGVGVSGASAPMVAEEGAGVVTRVRRSLVASVAILLSVAAISLGLTTVTASPAQAIGTSVISSNSGGANLRACAATSCRSLGWMRNGTNVKMRCYYDARQSTTGNYASPRWFLVWTSALGATGGYVHSSLVARQTGVPRC